MPLSETFLVQLISPGVSAVGFLAFFYGDPGSGTLIWQLLLASVVGAAFYVRFYFRRIRDAVSNARPRDAEREVETGAQLTDSSGDVDDEPASRLTATKE